MRVFVTIIIVVLLNSCKKETLKNEENFQRFIGVWKTINSNEKITIIFKANGEIEISNDVERKLNYFPTNFFKRDSNFKTGSYFWKEYSFDKYKHEKQKVDGSTIIINLTNDSLFYNYKNINNFIADSNFTTLLIKQ